MKIFAKHMYGKELVCKIYSKLLKFNNRKQKTRQSNWKRGKSIEHFNKEDVWQICTKRMVTAYTNFIYLFIYFICGGFCHTLKWNSHGFTCVPHPNPPSHLPFHPFPLGFPSAPGLSACLMYPTWAGDLFHPR